MATCESCKDLKPFNQEIHFTALIEAAAGGCRSCLLLKEGAAAFIEDFELVDRLRLVVDLSLFVHVLGRTPECLEEPESRSKATDDGQQCDVSDAGENLLEELGIIEFYTIPDRPVLWSKIGPGRHVSEQSSSDECITLAKEWLKTCLSSHLECARPDIPLLPTRVLEVGENCQQVKLRLSEPDEHGEYAALSHCWGSGNPVTLRKATLSQMRDSVVLDDTSKTFKEAIDVTRRLGIPYLWIDSLCIIQDDDNGRDWEIENAKMGDLYNNATVTICAAVSTSTAGGLFVDPKDRKRRNTTVELTCTSPSGSTETVYARLRHQTVFNILETVHSSLEPEIPHLDSRGWALQESSLSPRMLHFRKEELAWTCSTCSQCECRIRPSLPLPHPFRSPPGTEDDTEASAIVHLNWPFTVMDYSRRGLTVATDRVAALCGIQNYISGTTTDTCFGGIWYEDMSFQLLWYVETPAPSRFVAPYAPTWSWMSVPSAINYYNRYPAGTAPIHPAVQSMDAIQPFLHVNFVLRYPVDWDNLNGALIAAPLLLVAYALPVHYDVSTKQWTSTTHIVEDFIPSMLRVHIDVEEDLPDKHPNASYIFILAGSWKAEGHTIACLEAVCIVARRMTELDERLVQKARDLQQEQTEKYTEGVLKSKPLPELNVSYTRIGLVRGAGSFDAWEKADFPMSILWLF